MYANLVNRHMKYTGAHGGKQKQVCKNKTGGIFKKDEYDKYCVKFLSFARNLCPGA